MSEHGCEVGLREEVAANFENAQILTFGDYRGKLVDARAGATQLGERRKSVSHVAKRRKRYQANTLDLSAAAEQVDDFLQEPKNGKDLSRVCIADTRGSAFYACSSEHAFRRASRKYATRNIPRSLQALC